MIKSKRWFLNALALVALLFASSAHAQSALIVVVGDSNTAGFGVGRENAFPARLEAMLQATGYDVQVANAGVDGDTLLGMLARLDYYVPPGTSIVIVQGGYNDVQRDASSTELVARIEGILYHLTARRIKTVLCGFFYPDWEAVGRALAMTYGAIFVHGSYCYDGNHTGLDGLHMTEAGHQVVAGRLLPVIQQLLLRPTADEGSTPRERTGRFGRGPRHRDHDR